MAANRKLQTEIQQCLKKVEEGVELFDEIWGKVYAAEQQSLKEKYENDLKKEIKKLQRLRDQIKSWISGNEIKDKGQLLEARKTIETKMEMFKVCEKDTKTKAYSKEGLARDSKIDPKEQEREDKRNWLNDCLEKLHDLNTIVDGEKEKLSNGKSRVKNKDALEKLENRLQKHKWHISRIELIIRLLENDELDPSSLDAIKDSLEYYLETAAEDDGALGVEHEFDIYEDLQLDAFVNVDPAKVHANGEAEKTDHDVEPKEVPKTPVPAPQPVVAVPVAVKPPPSIRIPESKPAVVVKSEVHAPKVVEADEFKNALIKAAQEPEIIEPKATKKPIVDTPPPSLKQVESYAPTVSSQINNQVKTPTISAAPVSTPTAQVPAQSPVTPLPAPSLPTPPLAVPTIPMPTLSVPSLSSSVPSVPQPPVYQTPSNPLSPELMGIYGQLKQSQLCAVDNEMERSSNYTPKNFYGGCHASFPTVPAMTSQSEVANLFEKLPADSLFFGFYYQQNSMQQSIAAKRLKKSSWRFHKKYTTWFQRHSEPKISNQDFEEGTYIYFDYESGWCQRIKSDFKFEYAFLEDDV